MTTSMTHAWQRQPLRVRLVVLFTGLLLAALAVGGALAITLLRQSLIDEIDTRLTGAAQAMVNESYLVLTNRVTTSDELIPPEYAVVFATLDGTVTNRLTTTIGSPAVGSLALEDVQEHVMEPFTAPSSTGTGRWRVVVSPLWDSSGALQGTTAVGLPLDSAEETVKRMVSGLLTVGGAVALIAGIATYLMVSANLRPLRRIESTAAAIADGDLTQRIEDPPRPAPRSARWRCR